MNEGQERQVLWEGRFIRVLRHGRWEYVERVNASGAVAILAVTADARVLLVEQHRIPLGGRAIELPAGLVGDEPGEESGDLAQAARRELLEETGYAAKEMELLTGGPISAGLSNEMVSFVRATEVKKVGDGGGVGHEAIEVHEVPLTGLHDWLEQRRAAGTFVDPKVYTGLYFAERRGGH